MNVDNDFNVKNNLHNGWQVIFQKQPEEKFWRSETFNKLRNALYKKFKDYSEEEWEVYKSLNEITAGHPQKMVLSWQNFFSENKEETNLKGNTEIELEFYDEKNKTVVIKDPLVGISWDYDEPKEGCWICIPEKFAEKLIMIDSFKN